MDIYETERQLGIRLLPGGSRVTCDPPPTDTDRDFIAYVDGSHKLFVITELMLDGWDECKSGSAADATMQDRTTLRRGEDNIILVWNLATYEAFVACTDLARRMNLKSKTDRIELFATVRRLWPGTVENQRVKAGIEGSISVDDRAS